MARTEERNPLHFVGSSKVDLSAFPEEVKEDIGYALHQAQMGQKSRAAKPLKGFGGAGVLEIVDGFDGDTYRGVYTVKFADVVYVLHCFQKKSKKGRKLPKPDSDIIKRRLKIAEEDYEAFLKKATKEAKK